MSAKLTRKTSLENVLQITIYCNSIMMKFACAGFQQNALGWKLRQVFDKKFEVFQLTLKLKTYESAIVNNKAVTLSKYKVRVNKRPLLHGMLNKSMTI